MLLAVNFLRLVADFEERGSDGVDKIPDLLEGYLKFVAKTGDVL